MPVVLVEKKTPQITVVTLNRPERRNALSIQLLTELIASIKLASDEIRERILILSGAGAAFCTGLDLNEALKFADSVLQGAPNAVLQTKRMIDELWSTSVKDDLERALKHHMQARGSTEGREGITAFNEKRKPNWTV